MECMCAQTRPGKKFLEKGVRTIVNSMGKKSLYRKFRVGRNP